MLIVAVMANFNHSKVKVVWINVNPIKKLTLPALSAKKFARPGKKCQSTVMKPALIAAKQVNSQYLILNYV